MRKKILSLILAGAFVFSFAGCSSSSGNVDSDGDSAEAETLVIAYQQSVGYAPVIVMQQQNLIESCYDGDVTVEFVEESSGSTINDAVTSGSYDIGFMGLPPAIMGVKAGVPYKIFAGLSAQPYAIMTNDDSINSLSDIQSDDLIATNAINSQGHILLAMAAKAELDDATALNANLTVLANPDAYTSLITGSVDCHIVISPYCFMEADIEGVHEVEISEDIWPVGDTSLVGVASTELYEENPDLYNAVCEALDQAVTYVNDNPEETAEILTESL
ncbi:MAG: ABC transporter substrate-binding protein [Clostridiales bacterium]|nr:ABC transporter substrate-binding protein [Clostridiales bacterium]